MPSPAPRWCAYCRRSHPYGCDCPAIAADRREAVDRGRPGPRRRGYDNEWQRARALFLADHPYCVFCGDVATEVHHSMPHEGDQGVFWNRALWRPTCKACHSSETLRELRERRRLTLVTP